VPARPTRKRHGPSTTTPSDSDDEGEGAPIITGSDPPPPSETALGELCELVFSANFPTNSTILAVWRSDPNTTNTTHRGQQSDERHGRMDATDIHSNAEPIPAQPHQHAASAATDREPAIPAADEARDASRDGIEIRPAPRRGLHLAMHPLSQRGAIETPESIDAAHIETRNE